MFLVWSIICFGVLLIDLLLPYPYIALPVGILGIICCCIWYCKLYVPKYPSKNQSSNNANTQESPPACVVYVKAFKKWIEEFCRILIRSSLPYKIEDSKKNQANTNKKQYPNNNPPNTHREPPRSEL